ncbi:MAG: hypothetical protein HKO77_03440 [Gemmatimonadetes bacterium]|nr:hypothetical protein [Gemmatimonadota bacterium]NNL30046.1 hypothetical protein [Gemmatimonadota bacterium]
MNLVFIVMWVVSIAFSAVIGLAAITYIRRTWQLIRVEDDDATRDRLLDGMDHLENQMHLVAERLGRLEGRLERLDARLDTADDPAALEAGEPDIPVSNSHRAGESAP